jgi:hypothetical protein
VDLGISLTLPGEAEKAAKIWIVFLVSTVICGDPNLLSFKQHHLSADPERPQSALNSIPKAVL